MGCGGSTAISTEEAMASVAAEAPEIPIAGEEFLFAFAWSRDQIYFTNYRILVKDKQGMFGSSIKWKTIPYSSIQAFFVETAGWGDPNVTLGLWPSGYTTDELSREKMMESPCYEISFKKGDGVDLFALNRLLNNKIFGVPEGEAAVEVAPQPEGEEEGSGVSKFMDLLGGDASAIDPSIVQEQLRLDPPVLLPNEVVDMAFKCGRDTYALTSKRMLVIDVKGVTGKMVRYMSYLWSSIKAFAVETPGAFLDRDCQIKLWNGISHVDDNLFSMDLRCLRRLSRPSPLRLRRGCLRRMRRLRCGCLRRLCRLFLLALLRAYRLQQLLHRRHGRAEVPDRPHLGPGRSAAVRGGGLSRGAAGRTGRLV